jgi:6-phosphogluconate dehydrogenase
MNSTGFDIGIVGLGVMGANLGKNIADHGFSVVGHDVDQEKVHAFLAGTSDRGRPTGRIAATSDLRELVARLRRPRAIVLLVPSGATVDKVIASLAPLLEREDIIVDAGNSHYSDTARRSTDLAQSCIHYLGMGVSGGAAGARHGPSLMPGGSKAAWETLQPILETIAAQVGGEPCAVWLGRDGAGHYVKMVHNGIEYGLMELIAESYDLLRRGLRLDHEALHDIFVRWNEAGMESFLLQITAEILLAHDDLGKGFLLDKIRDAAYQKGTGMWTSREAMEIETPVPVIDAAVSMRALSGYVSERDHAHDVLGGPGRTGHGPNAELVTHLGEALHGAMLITFAQGLHLLRRGSQHHGLGLRLDDVLKVWRGGCIIRTRMLDDLRAAYLRVPALRSPLFDDDIAIRLFRSQAPMREVVAKAARWGLPTPAFMAALGYYDAFRSARLPANLIQAQRDYFGAHTFERLDRPGHFHARWGNG